MSAELTMPAAKDEWYRDRILWRARRHNTGTWPGLCIGDSIDAERTVSVQSTVGEPAIPLVLFWDSEERWTAVTASELIGYEDGKLNRIHLDAINKLIEIEGWPPRRAPDPGAFERASATLASAKITKVVVSPSAKAQEVKLTSDHLFVGPQRLRFWAPPRQAIHALWNLLRMFPLNVR